MGGGIWQMIAQGVTDIASSALGQWQANKAAKRAWRQYKHRISKTVEDLYRAGLNPILALGGGGGIAGGGTPGIGDTIGQGRSSAVSAYNEARRTAAETKNIEQQTELAKDLQFKARDEDYEASERGNLMAAQRAETLSKLPGASRKQRAEINALTAEAGLNSARQLNEQEMRGKARAEGLLYQVPAELIRRTNSALDSYIKGL